MYVAVAVGVGMFWQILFFLAMCIHFDSGSSVIERSSRHLVREHVSTAKAMAINDLMS